MKKYNLRKVGDYIHLSMTWMDGTFFRQTTGITTKHQLSGGKARESETNEKLAKLRLLIRTSEAEGISVDVFKQRLKKFAIKSKAKSQPNLDTLAGIMASYLDLLTDPNVDILDKPRGHSPSTIRQLRAAISQWSKFGVVVHVNDYDINQGEARPRIKAFNKVIKDFIRFLSTKNRSVSTISNYIGKIDTVLSWANDAHFIRMEYGRINLPKQKPDKFSMPNELFEYLLRTKDSSEYNRAFKIHLLTGLRFGDLAYLTQENVECKNGQYYINVVQKKTSQEVTIPIPQQLATGWDILLSDKSREKYTKYIRSMVYQHKLGHKKVKKTKTFLNTTKVFEEKMYQVITTHDIRKASLSYFQEAGLNASVISGHTEGSKVFSEVYDNSSKYRRLKPFISLVEGLAIKG